MRRYISCKIKSNSLDKQTGMQSTSLRHNTFRRKTLGVGWPLQPVVVMNCVQGFLRKVTLGAMGPLQYLLLAPSATTADNRKNFRTLRIWNTCLRRFRLATLLAHSSACSACSSGSLSLLWRQLDICCAVPGISGPYIGKYWGYNGNYCNISGLERGIVYGIMDNKWKLRI